MDRSRRFRRHRYRSGKSVIRVRCLTCGLLEAIATHQYLSEKPMTKAECLKQGFCVLSFLTFKLSAYSIV